MNEQRTHRETPEDRELQKKRAELSALENELINSELALATLREEVQLFERRYLRTVGVLFAELDDLNARLAEARARRTPQDPNLQERAEHARTRATESANVVGELPEENAAAEFAPRDDVKALYREVAKLVHPDLSLDERERVRRTQLMAEASRAYAAGDDDALRRIIDEWVSSPESVKGDGTAAELVRAIRKIHQIQRRLETIAANTVDIRASELYSLMERVSAATRQRRDLLADMAETLKRQIAVLRMVLSDASRRAGL